MNWDIPYSWIDWASVVDNLDMINVGLSIILTALIIVTTLYAIRRKSWAKELQPFRIEFDAFREQVENKIETIEEVNSMHEKRHDDCLLEIRDMFYKTQKAVSNQANMMTLHLAEAKKDKEIAELKEKTLDAWRLKIDHQLDRLAK